MLWAALVFGAFLGGFIQPIVGFGSALILVLFLSPFFSMAIAPSLAAGISIGLCGLMLWRYRKSVDWHGALFPVAVYTVVNVLVIRMLGSFDLKLLTMVFGAFLVVLSIYYLFFAKKVSVRPSRVAAFACSAFSGITGGLFSVGGPMMALYFVASTDDYRTYVGNLQFLFTVTNIVSAVMRAASGLYPVSLLPATLLGTAAIIAGEYIGARVSAHVNAANIKTVVYIGVGVSGLLTLVEQLL